MNNMDAIINLLVNQGWLEDGVTQLHSFKTASLAYGGGTLVTLGGRRRFKKGNWKVTVGKRTTCFYLRPENPETTTGTGKLAGQRVYTFRDWEQRNFLTKGIEQIRALVMELI